MVFFLAVDFLAVVFLRDEDEERWLLVREEERRRYVLVLRWCTAVGAAFTSAVASVAGFSSSTASKWRAVTSTAGWCTAASSAVARRAAACLRRTGIRKSRSARS
ncbi:DUF4231 domain-containing protein [Hymenobacter sediminis]|nr:DUF4231 domain-containing protein [Hymenobacter sediminis]